MPASGDDAGGSAGTDDGPVGGGTRADDRADDRADRRGPPPRRGRDGGNGSWKLFVRDVVTSVLAVALVGAYLFAVSGVWPPLVAIETGSMEPNMNVNDLVFVMETDRFPPDAAHGGTGVVTARTGSETGYHQFNGDGDVIIFAPNGRTDATPVIHRAMFWVNESENWYDKVDESYVGSADSCADIDSCPAPHDGFITKGDANPQYDQTRSASLSSLNEPVRPEWVVGTAQQRIPGLGWLRLRTGS